MSNALNPLARLAARCVLRRMIGPQGESGERVIRLEKFGIGVEDAASRERILGVLRAFFGGFEDAILEPSALADARPETLYAPFFHEGAAMGFGAGALFRLRSTSSMVERFETAVVPQDDPFRFLRYVGLGFWLGFRLGARAEKVDGLVRGLSDRRLRHLVHDGYGFQFGFFELARRPRRVKALRRLQGFGRASAFNGLGRSLWFFYMDRPEDGILRARAFAEDGLAVFGGMGLAAAFTRVDDLSRAYAVADLLHEDERRAFEKGIRIALYCRHESDPAYLDECLHGLPVELASRVRVDIAHAVSIGKATASHSDFIEVFHAGCLDAPRTSGSSP